MNLRQLARSGAAAAIPFCAAATSAPAQEQAWIRQSGTSGWDFASALASAGPGVFVSGSTEGELGGPNAGGLDGWLALYDDGGGQAWIVQFGTDVIETAWLLCPEGSGGAYVAGYTYGDLGGENAGGADIWLARYDAAGNRAWVHQFGSIAIDDPRALIPDGAGGVFIAGRTEGDLDGGNSGGSDAWLARFDGSGSRGWIRQFGTGGSEWARALASDGGGGVFIAGWTSGSLGGGNAGSGDAWLARFDGAGGQTWVRQIGSGAWDEARALEPDGAGGAFVAGVTEGSLGGAHAGGSDIWMARYDASGGQAWILQYGTSEYEEAWSLAPDGAGGVFIAGSTNGDLGGPNAGPADVWLARHDGAGGQAWIHQFGTAEFDSASALASDGAGGVYVAGFTSGSLGGSNAGSYDAWLARYGALCAVDLNGDGDANTLDFLEFLNLWASNDAAADWDQNGMIDTRDFLAYLNEWVAGC